MATSNTTSEHIETLYKCQYCQKYFQDMTVLSIDTYEVILIDTISACISVSSVRNILYDLQGLDT